MRSFAPFGPVTCSGRSPRLPGSAPIPGCSSTRRSTSGTRPRTPIASTGPTPVRSTCTSTTRRAIWRALNLLKFLDADGTFDHEGFKAAVEVVFTAQEILVGYADYPTEPIAENSRRFRQLGLGYANLGALLMALGASLRLRLGPGAGRHDHEPDDRPRVRHLRSDRGPYGALCRLRRERRAHAEGAGSAPAGGRRHRRDAGVADPAGRGPAGVGRSSGSV